VGKRDEVYTAMQGAILASTGVSYVTIDVNDDPWAWKGTKFPGVKLYDGEDQITRLSYLQATEDDMESEIPFDFIGYVRKLTSSTESIEIARNNLMVDIEKALVGDTTVASLVKDIYVQERGTDKGYNEGVGWSSGVVRVLYHYNHLSP